MIRPIELYRASHWCYNNIPKKRGSYFFKVLNRALNGCDITPSAKIDKSVKIFHPVGIVIGSCLIEADVIIYSGVKIINTKRIINGKKIKVYPTIKKGSILYTNSMIMGNITIEKNTICGANSMILRNTYEEEKCTGLCK